ncbi:MAG: hypothetical protein DWQ05_09970 [Calditrichaeota bacterium]|nr:MAG: hypothetical protein DWQ05_09970 [Calditrichota bacterium]
MAQEQRAADYRSASPEERENVINIVKKNYAEIKRNKKLDKEETYDKIIARLEDNIRGGEVIKGRDFEFLIGIFRKKLN